MKSKLLLLFILLITFSSCSDDDSKTEEATQMGKYSIKGKFLAPNSVDPIAQANVHLFSNNTEVATTLTNETGNFFFTQLQEGEYKVLLEKGHFSSEETVVINESNSVNSIDIGDIDIQTFPKIGVVTGLYDNIEHVLYDIGLVNPITNEPLFDIIDGGFGSRPEKDNAEHAHRSQYQGRSNTNTLNLDANVSFTFPDLLNDPALLAEYDILFFNCGLDTSLAFDNSNLYDYVNNGGILYVTDWAFPFLEQINLLDNTNYVTYANPYKSGVSLTTDATILNSSLSSWLNTNFGIGVNGVVTINEFLNSWQVVETYDSANVIPWLNGSVEYFDGTNNVINNKDLAFTYLVGSGGVFYSSFHTENEESGFSDVDRIMEYMVFELSTFETVNEED